MTDRELVRQAVEIISQKKGEELVIVDFGDVSMPASYFVIAEADNPVHAKALVTALREQLPENPLHSEGLTERKWIVLDYGDVVVHIFDREARAFYDLDSLWADHIVALRALAE
ncbi:MAG: ribosome silencing factor [Candidatus Bipolaricaulota bacterium]|nr:ribosome silencing factor [Candidatus Bipolaricaulota bacterium]